MKKKFDWKYFGLGVLAGVVIYAMGWIPASIANMFNSSKNSGGK